MKPDKYKNISNEGQSGDDDQQPQNADREDADDPNAPYDYLGQAIIPIGMAVLAICLTLALGFGYAYLRIKYFPPQCDDCQKASGKFDTCPISPDTMTNKDGRQTS